MSKRVKIGIDLGATRLKMALVDEKGRIFYRREINTPFNAKKAELINSIVTNVREIVKKSGLKKKDILGIGIGVPGPVDSEKGIVRYFPNIKGWKEVALKAILQKKLGIRWPWTMT